MTHAILLHDLYGRELTKLFVRQEKNETYLVETGQTMKTKKAWRI